MILAELPIEVNGIDLNYLIKKEKNTYKVVARFIFMQRVCLVSFSRGSLRQTRREWGLVMRTMCSRLKYSLSAILIAVSCLYLTACSEAELPRLTGDDTILAFGDSLTQGYGVKAPESYPAVLQRLTAFKVINAGVSGETSEQGLERLPELLEQLEQENKRPALVILLEGGNDVLRKVPEAQISQNIAKMIEITQSKGIPILLVGVPEKKLFGSTLALYEDLAEAYQIPLEDDIVASLVMRPSMKSDYIHFNAQGYQLLAEAIYQKLQQAGAVE